MKSLRIVLALLIVLVGGAAIVIFSGAIDVAATTPDPGFVKAILNQAREHSIERRSKLIPVPSLDSAAQVAKGLEEYQEMCAVCHGGPGREHSAIAQGLNPAPPQFSRSLRDDPAETFWIVKNGIKMTGMPGFGPTHDDETIWAMVAFLRKIDELTPEQKAALAKGGEEEEEHLAGEEHH